MKFFLALIKVTDVFRLFSAESLDAMRKGAENTPSPSHTEKLKIRPPPPPSWYVSEHENERSQSSFVIILDSHFPLRTFERNDLRHLFVKKHGELLYGNFHHIFILSRTSSLPIESMLLLIYTLQNAQRSYCACVAQYTDNAQRPTTNQMTGIRNTYNNHAYTYTPVCQHTSKQQK